MKTKDTHTYIYININFWIARIKRMIKRFAQLKLDLTARQVWSDGERIHRLDQILQGCAACDEVVSLLTRKLLLVSHKELIHERDHPSDFHALGGEIWIEAGS